MPQLAIQVNGTTISWNIKDKEIINEEKFLLINFLVVGLTIFSVLAMVNIKVLKIIYATNEGLKLTKSSSKLSLKVFTKVIFHTVAFV